MARSAVRCDPGGRDLAALRIFRHQEPARCIAEGTGEELATGNRGPGRGTRLGARRRQRRFHDARGGADMQTVRTGQLPAETLQDFH